MNLDLLIDAVMIFLGIVIEATPFIILGVLISAFVAVFIKTETLLRILPKGRITSTVSATFFGFLFPVCECGNVPVARRLILKGVPPHVAITFLMSAPVFNPIVILATLAAFPSQPEMLWYRLGLSIGIAILLGLFFSFHKNPKDLLTDKINLKIQNHEESEHAHENKLKRFFSIMIREFFEMMAVLTIGAFIASSIQAFIPRTTIINIGQGAITSVLAMMILAVLVSICSNVDAFFALSFTNTFTMGSILAFLVLGPMIDIKVWIMLRSIFKVKTIVLLTLFTAQLVFLSTLFINLNL